jgi:uncharacterized membrane protein YagU involved in acid resistance
MCEKPAPEVIGAHVESAVGLREYLAEPDFQVSWLLQHFGYGVNAGVGYALLQKRLPKNSSLLAGTVYGIGLYLVGYAGWLPLAHLYPPPTQVPRRKVALLVAEHIVFGATTALTYRTIST